MYRIQSFVWLGAVLVGLTCRGQDTAARPYDWLDVKSLPPPSALVEASIKALPKSLSQKQDWLKRMRRAAWYPQMQLQYRVGETVVRDYDVVDRVEKTTSSETTRSSSRDSSSRSSSSSGSGTEVVTDGGGVLADTHTSTSADVGSEHSSSHGSSVSRRSGTSTTYSGPDSYATGEDFKWGNEVGVYLTWDLSRFVFQGDEIDVVNAEIDRETFRQNVKVQVIQSYYDLLESLLLLENPNYRDSIPTKVRKERLAYLLDTMSGGYLSQSTGHNEP